MIHELSILSALLPELGAAPDVPVGPGDDCAAIDLGGGVLLLAAVDQLIGGVHFVTAETPPRVAGAKLIKRNLSDIAAMGGTPKWALLTLAAEGRSDEYLLEFALGAAEEGRKYNVPVVGGDLASLPPGSNLEVSTLTILGTVPASEIVKRSGARPGDLLYVTGALGNSFHSGRHLDFTPRLAEGRFLAQNGCVSAMLDISDGTLLDASRLAAASGVAIELDPARLPRHLDASLEGALSDGEDYELLFTVPADKENELLGCWPATFAPLTRIGRARGRERPGTVLSPAGNDLLQNRRSGYVH